MLVFFFTDIEGSTRLWEEHTAVMTAVIARHDEILRQLIDDHGGRITKHTGDGITAVFEAGQPLACALQAQLRFAAEPWEAIGALPIRAGLHAGEAEFHPSAGTPDGDYFGPPVNATARIMSAAWGGQILFTPEVTQASSLPDQATLLDLGQHLLKNVSAPQQLYQLLHPQLPRHEFPPPRTLSGQSIQQAVGERGGQLAGLEPEAMGIALLGTTLLPALQGELDPESGALEGNLGVLEELGALSLRRFMAALAGRLRSGEPIPAGDLQLLLQDELQAQWQAGGETALALRSDASRLLQAVHGVDAAMMAASGEVKEALARGLADLGGQFAEFRWMLGGVQETLAEVQAGQRVQVALQLEQAAMQREQLELQRQQLARTDLLVRLQLVGEPVPPWLEGPPQLPAFLERDPAAEQYERPVFVAREGELVRIEGFLEQALSGKGSAVFVTGGPGRGKTALLHEFARRAMEANEELLVAYGQCNAYSGPGDPYLPFREVLGMLSGDVEGRWASGRISGQHARRLWAVVPEVVRGLQQSGPHLLGTLVPGEALLSRARAADVEDAWLDALWRAVQRRRVLDEGLEQSHLFQQVTNVLRALSERHPLLLVLDDLQWADSASIGLLFHLGRRLGRARILLAGAYRPEELALGRDGVRLGEGERHPLDKVLNELKRLLGDVWVDLGRVAEPEGRAFVDALLATESNRLGEGFREALLAHTGGHPLFAVELLRAMQERGDLVQDGAGRWVEGGSLDWGALPARVEAVIEERIGRLERELRETLNVASVEGEDFTAQVVARVQEVSDRRLLQTLSQELERRHRLVRGRGEEQVGRQRLSRYRFAHALFQQYLYNDLSPGECQLLHQEVAAVLEELYEGNLEEIAAPLAYHFSEAGDEGRALKYLILAGDRALASYAHPEAEGYYRRALDLAPGESERVHLLSGLGEALQGQGRFQEAIETWRQGIDLYRALDDTDGLARLYARSAWVAREANDPEEALKLGLEGLAAVEGAPESPGLAHLLDTTARVYGSKRMEEEGEPLARQALEMAERLGDVEMQAHALATLGGFFLKGEEAIAALAKAVEVAESNGLLHASFRAHHNLSIVSISVRGDYSAALHQRRRAAELIGRGGNTAQQIDSLCTLAYGLANAGGFEEAETILSRVRALLDDLAEPGRAVMMAHETEMTHAALCGEWDTAARIAREMQSAERERGNDGEVAWKGVWLAYIVLESLTFGGDAPAGQWEEAEAVLAEAIEIYDASPYQEWGVTARTLLVPIYLTQGRLDEARRILAEVRGFAGSMAFGDPEARPWRLTAMMAAAEGHRAEALAAIEAGVGIETRAGDYWLCARDPLDWAEAYATLGEPADLERARELLRQAQAAFEEMGVPRYAAVAADRLQALAAGEAQGTYPR